VSVKTQLSSCTATAVVERLRSWLPAGFVPCVQNQEPKVAVHRVPLSVYVTSIDSFLYEYRRAGSVEAQYKLLVVHKRSYLRCFFHLKLITLAQEKPRTRTLLHVAVSYGSAKFVAFFLQYGASVEAVDQKGRTALHQAVLRRSGRLIPPLIAGAKDLNVPDEDGDTALLVAAKCCFIPAVRLLVGRCDINAVNAQGRTAVHYPCQMAGDPRALEMMRYLKSANPDLSILDKQKMSPLDYLMLSSSPGFISTLMQGVAQPSSEIFERKLLAHVFDIPGRSRLGKISFSYGMLPPCLVEARFMRWCQAFVESDLFKNSAFKLKSEAILEPLQQPNSVPEAVEAILKGRNRVFYPQGQGHEAALVFAANGLVMKCDRAAGAMVGEPGIHLYRAQSYKKLAQALELFRKGIESVEHYHKTLDQLLKLKWMACIKEPRPKLDNSCTWVARASSLRALFYALFIHKGHAEAVRCSEALYNLWEGFVKEISPPAYLSQSLHPDLNILSRFVPCVY
jgi:hypothetical protein